MDPGAGPAAVHRFTSANRRRLNPPAPRPEPAAGLSRPCRLRSTAPSALAATSPPSSLPVLWNADPRQNRHRRLAKSPAPFSQTGRGACGFNQPTAPAGSQSQPGEDGVMSMDLKSTATASTPLQAARSKPAYRLYCSCLRVAEQLRCRSRLCFDLFPRPSPCRAAPVSTAASRRPAYPCWASPPSMVAPGAVAPRQAGWLTRPPQAPSSGCVEAPLPLRDAVFRLIWPLPPVATALSCCFAPLRSSVNTSAVVKVAFTGSPRPPHVAAVLKPPPSGLTRSLPWPRTALAGAGVEPLSPPL